ncbi:MAG: type 1 glutamine amidotransferase [Beijerinckiaceae bacterium]|nr:type 1 glutamine amidotransferase [Beijerinckiaceae bacterium]
MGERLNGCVIAVLATDGVEQIELTEPVAALRREGAEVHVVSDKADRIQGFHHHDRGDRIKVDMPLDEAEADKYDGLVLPGGVINPDALRLAPAAIRFIRHFVDKKRPIAAICHGPWTLIEAGGASGKTMTSWPSLKTDLGNAGARWIDQDVVVDGNLVTSRKPDDLPAFNAKLIELLERATRRPNMAE